MLTLFDYTLLLESNKKACQQDISFTMTTRKSYTPPTLTDLSAEEIKGGLKNGIEGSSGLLIS